MRDLVCIYTGQGAAGDFKRVAIYTGQFGSCSPVVMYNDQTCIGALYHLPGKSGRATKLMNEEWDSLLALLRKVDPTVIYLYPAGDYARKQGFLGGEDPNIQVRYKNRDEEVGRRQAKERAFDRSFRGDQKHLNAMFSKAQAALTMSYNIQLVELSQRGIQVTADDAGTLSVSAELKTLGGATYDLSKRRPPEELCMIVNPDIDYSLWVQQSL